MNSPIEPSRGDDGAADGGTGAAGKDFCRRDSFWRSFQDQAENRLPIEL